MAQILTQGWSQLWVWNILMFHYLFLERDCMCEQGRNREGERESQTSSTLSGQSPMRGLISWTTRLWLEPKSRVWHLTNCTTQMLWNILFLDLNEQERKNKFKLSFFNVYFWERQRQSMSWGGAEREGATESKAGSRLWAVSTETDVGLELMNCVRSWPEPKLDA